MEKTISIPSMLVIILEIDYDRYRVLDVNDVIGFITLFCNSYSLMHRQNQLSVMVHTPRDIHTIYPTESNRQINPFIPVYHTLSHQLTSHLHQILSDEIEQQGNPSSSNSSNGDSSNRQFFLSKAFSKALCIINRQVQTFSLQPRILVFQFGKDRPISYNALMNSIFSAQKLNVAIDALVVSKDDSHFMQVFRWIFRYVFSLPHTCSMNPYIPSYPLSTEFQ
jgi:transcription initiation factor TFIIH subunit 3